MSRILTEREVNQYSPLALAFLGDSVYEKLVRECIVLSANMPASKLHDLKVKKVCASFQSESLDKIMPLLDTKEIAIVKRGRNATGNTVPKSSNAIEYRRATGLECLFGYLDLLGKAERIEQLFNIIIDK